MGVLSTELILLDARLSLNSYNHVFQRDYKKQPSLFSDVKSEVYGSEPLYASPGLCAVRKGNYICLISFASKIQKGVNFYFSRGLF